MDCGYGEKLILYFYGEAGAELKAGMEAHLKTCAACRGSFAALAAAEGALREETPLPSASVLAAVMSRARAALAGEKRRPFFSWTWAETAFAGALAAALVMAFAAAPRGNSPELAWNSGLDSTLDSVEYSLYRTQSDQSASAGDWDYNYGLLNAEGQALDTTAG